LNELILIFIVPGGPELQLWCPMLKIKFCVCHKDSVVLRKENVTLSILSNEETILNVKPS